MTSPTARTLSDADVKAIVAELRKEITTTFYKDLGRGIWAVIWQAVAAALVGLAAWKGLK